MLDDLSIFSQIIWEEVLEAIPSYLKFKETDRKVYRVSDSLGVASNGVRERCYSTIDLKLKSSIAITWHGEYVECKTRIQRRLKGALVMEHKFPYTDSIWLKSLITTVCEIIAVADAQYHIDEEKPYKLIDADRLFQRIMDNLLSHTRSDITDQANTDQANPAIP